MIAGAFMHRNNHHSLNTLIPLQLFLHEAVEGGFLIADSSHEAATSLLQQRKAAIPLQCYH